jgi:hypothetical protein
MVVSSFFVIGLSKKFLLQAIARERVLKYFCQFGVVFCQIESFSKTQCAMNTSSDLRVMQNAWGRLGMFGGLLISSRWVADMTGPTWRK